AQRDGMTRLMRSNARQPAPAAPARSARAQAHRMHASPAASREVRCMRASGLALLCLVGSARLAAQDTAIVINPESVSVTRQPPALPRLVAEGAVRAYREPLAYRTEGEEIALAPEGPRRWLRNLGLEKSWGTAESRSSLTLGTGGTFNRVEGLPVVFGPILDWRLQQNVRLRLDALGVWRTAGDFTNKRSDLGYLLRTELRAGE